MLIHSDYEAMLPLPVVTISDQPRAFAPGACGAVCPVERPGRRWGFSSGRTNSPCGSRCRASVPSCSIQRPQPSTVELTLVSGIGTLPYNLRNNPSIIGLRGAGSRRGAAYEQPAAVDSPGAHRALIPERTVPILR